jgi:hypothetical protein
MQRIKAKISIIGLNFFVISLISSSNIHHPKFLHQSNHVENLSEISAATSDSGMQSFIPHVIMRLLDWGVDCERHAYCFSIIDTLDNYVLNYRMWRDSISNFDFEFFPSRWLILSSIKCDCNGLLVEMVNAMHLARVLNYTIIIDADHFGPFLCDCHENVASVIPFMTTGFLEQHDVFLSVEYELDLNRELECVMSTHCSQYFHQWSTIILKNSAEDIIAIAPNFFQAQQFEEYLGINFLILIHVIWSGHEFDFLAEYPCLSWAEVTEHGSVQSGNMMDLDLPRALGRCIRRNTLNRQRINHHIRHPSARTEGTSQEFWYCSPCSPNQSWPWNDSISFVSSFSNLKQFDLHMANIQSQKRAADAYQAQFKKRLFDAPHTCGSICEHCTVTKGLFFLARELTTCSGSRQGYYELLNTWRWLQGFEKNFHDFFERNSLSLSGNTNPVTCEICVDLDKGLLKIWDTAHALRLIYTLNSTFELEVESILPLEMRKTFRVNKQLRDRQCIIGVHMRRGDSCIDTVGSSSKRRECHSVSKYLSIAMDYQKANNECKTLFVSSDDANAVLEMVLQANDSFSVLVANVNREKYAVNGSVGRDELIERRAFSDKPLDRLEIITEAIADVYGLSRCDMIIGHLGESVFSQTALLLNFAFNGVMPPFATINFPMCYYWRYWEGLQDFMNTNVSAFDCL